MSNYNIPNDQNQYNNQQYNARPNGCNWQNNNQSNWNNWYNQKSYNLNLKFQQNSVRCYYYKKEGNVSIWKKVIEENKNSILKVGMNVYMVKKDQLVVDVCVTTWGQKVRILKVDMPIEKLLKIEISPTKGRKIKWEKDKLIHKDVINELRRIQ